MNGHLDKLWNKFKIGQCNITFILHDYLYTHKITSECDEIYKIDTLILIFFKSIHRKRRVGPRPNEEESRIPISLVKTY